jgi:hypothetical protein
MPKSPCLIAYLNGASINILSLNLRASVAKHRGTVIVKEGFG